MKSELNHYNISNPDGVDKTKYSEDKMIYQNDDSHSVKEDAFENQSEWYNSASEDMSFGSSTENTDKTNTQVESENVSSAMQSSAVSTMSSVAGSGLGAIAGAIASTVMSAIFVVVAFISTLTVHLSLVMASMDSLVFQVGFSGVQENDYEMPMFAILENKNGDYREQEISFDSLYITFNDLEPGTEYVIIIKNEEKEFVKQSYYTASNWEEKGFISAFYEADEVFVFVEDIKLNVGEYYTLTAKDSNGKVVFSTDDIDPNKDFHFKPSEKQNLYFTLSIGGKVVCVTQIELDPDSHDGTYDFENGVWNWADNNTSATVSFAEIYGGSPLVLTAQVRSTYYEPTCEDDAYYYYFASTEYEGESYSTSKTVTQTGTAHGHNFVPRGFVWEHNEQDQLIAIGEGVCSTCEQVYRIPAEMTNNGDLYIATIIYNDNEYTDNRVEINLTDRESSISEDNHYYIKPYSFVFGSSDSTEYIDFRNNAAHPYVIRGSANQIANSIDINNTGILSRSDYYFVFDNLNIVADPSIPSTIFRLNTTCNVTIHIDVIGEVEFTTSDTCSFFASTTREGITVTFDINYLDEDSSFTCFDDFNETTNYYDALDLDVIFKINGYRFDPEGEVINQYDFTQGTWSWLDDYTVAYISFPEINGGEPMVYEVFVQSMETPASCEESGSIVYTASIYVEEADQLFSDEQVVELQPTNHDFSRFVEEIPAGCETDGILAHYECLNCHKCLDENMNETTLEDLTIHAIGHLEPTLLTSQNISSEMVGKKVYLMLDDRSIGVALGQENNMSTDQSLFTEFTITAISGSQWSDLKVTIVSPDGYYLTKAYSNIAFTNTTEQEIIVGSTGGLNAGNDLDAYMIIYEEGVIKLENALSLEAEYIHMFILKPSHNYGELIEDNHEGNGLIAHYECSVCHKLFVNENGDYIEKTANELEYIEPGTISLQEGPIYINTNGYARSENNLSNPTEFVSSASKPYMIYDQEINGCDNIINVYQTDSSIATADVYIKLKDVTIEANSWCSLFRIFATNTLNIHLIIEGDVTFIGGDGQQVFSSQGSGAPTVNIIIDQTTAGGTFNARADDGLTYAQSGTINVSYV